MFEERLHPQNIEREEVKQIISIFASRMFSANLPDTELEFEENEKGLFVSEGKRIVRSICRVFISSRI